MSIAIETKDLAFSYPAQAEDSSIPVFRDLDLQIQEGSFVAVLGHNGCGKSTLAKHFNAILLPEGGSVCVFGCNTANDDLLLEIRKTCESLNMRFVQRGELPEDQRAAYILTCAVRECVTNAVRYAGASELYAKFAENAGSAIVAVSNNGKQPDGKIVEGGGLSTLRRRVERAGGSMVLQSLPEFQLTVTVPKEMEGVSL